jgi:hypothetical protein
MESANLVDDSEKQVIEFISPNLSIGGRRISDGDILTITNVSRSMYSQDGPIPIIYKAVVRNVSFIALTIILTLTETNDDEPGYREPGEKVYLQNDDGTQRDNQMRSRIIIYHQERQRVVDSHDDGEIRVEPIPNGYVYVTNVTAPPDQGGGYKRRKNKSKRKNKRSVRRRIKKRSNICRKNKKVTKRLRKSRRRVRR